MKILRSRLGKRTDQRLDHNGVVIILISLIFGHKGISTNAGRDRKRSDVIAPPASPRRDDISHLALRSTVGRYILLAQHWKP